MHLLIFCPLFFEAMDLNMEYIYKHFIESSDEEDRANETTMMQALLADAGRAKKHVLNFNGWI